MKLKFDVSGSDPDKATGANFEPAKPGVYQCRIEETTVSNTKKGDQMITVTYEIVTPGSEKGKKLWDRIVLTDAAKWKLDQFLQALGLATKRKRKGTLDLEAVIGEQLTVVVKQGEYNGSPTAEVSRVSAPADEDDLEEDDDLEDEDDDDLDEDEDESDDEDEDEDEGDEDEEEDEDEDEDAEDDGYETMSIAELRAELKERELNSKGAKPALIARLRENDEEEPF
jgi:hypothetical protein